MASCEPFRVTNCLCLHFCLSVCMFVCLYVCMSWDASNKIDITRFRLQSTMICYDFSFQGYVHLRWLWNYGGRVTSKFIFAPNFVEKRGSSKINSNLKKWLFQIGWKIMLFGYSLFLRRNTEPKYEQNSIWKWLLYLFTTVLYDDTIMSQFLFAMFSFN